MGEHKESHILLKMVYIKGILYECKEKIESLVSIGSMLGTSKEHAGNMFQAVM